MVHVKKCPYGSRSKTSTEFYIGDRPQIYCCGWVNPQNEELVEICKNCADHISKAQTDFELIKKKIPPRTLWRESDRR